MNTNHQHPLGIAIDGPAWSLAWAQPWRPLLERHRSELEWMLDRAIEAAHELPDERACVERFRTALAKLIEGNSASTNTRDVMFTIALVLAAAERDLGPVVHQYVARMARTYQQAQQLNANPKE